MTKYKTFKLVLAIVVTLLSYGATIGLAGITLVNPWGIVAGSVVFAVAVSLFAGKWRSVEGSFKKYMCLIGQIALVAGVTMALIYGLNCGFASKESLHREEAVVERVYYETRYQQRRVGRNRYVRGEPYKVYYMAVELPGGWHKSLPINAGDFRTRHKGDTLALPVARGLLGMPVIRRGATLD